MKDSKVIALFGKSCVGKSEVAAKLAIRLNLSVRHCGELVKHRAMQLGVPTSDLSEAEHHAIDTETLSLAEKSDDDIIMEGTFLDNVLADVSKAILVELTCEQGERRRRYIMKSGDADLTLELRDEDDQILRSNLHGTNEGTNAKTQVREIVSINTTKLTSDEVVSIIIETLDKLP